MKVTREQLKQIIKEELEAVLSEQELGLGDRFRDKLFRTVFPGTARRRRKSAERSKYYADKAAAREKAAADKEAEEEAANKRAKDAATYKKRKRLGQAASKEARKSRQNLEGTGFGRDVSHDKLVTLINREVDTGGRNARRRADYTASILSKAYAHLALLRRVDPDFYDPGASFRSLKDEIQSTQDFIKALKDYGKRAESAASQPSFQQFDSAGTDASFDPKTQVRRGNQILRKSNFSKTSRFD